MNGLSFAALAILDALAAVAGTITANMNGYIVSFSNAKNTFKSSQRKETIMSNPYRCPNCKTNRSRFNLIEQIPHSVKKDPASGEIIKEYSLGELQPFHLPYNGPELKIQCAACGLIEDERTFIKFGERTM